MIVDEVIVTAKKQFKKGDCVYLKHGEFYPRKKRNSVLIGHVKEIVPKDVFNLYIEIEGWLQYKIEDRLRNAKVAIGTFKEDE